MEKLEQRTLFAGIHHINEPIEIDNFTGIHWGKTTSCDDQNLEGPSLVELVDDIIEASIPYIQTTLEFSGKVLETSSSYMDSILEAGQSIGSAISDGAEFVERWIGQSLYSVGEYLQDSVRIPTFKGLKPAEFASAMDSYPEEFNKFVNRSYYGAGETAEDYFSQAIDLTGKIIGSAGALTSLGTQLVDYSGQSLEYSCKALQYGTHGLSALGLWMQSTVK